MKDTIKKLEKNNKEGIKLTRKYVKTAFDCEEGGMGAMINHVLAEEELNINIQERKMLLKHLKEIVNG